MTTEETTDLTGVEFGVTIYKRDDGNIELTPVEGYEPNTVDDIYQVICLLKRNIEAQHSAAVMHHTMMSIAAQAQAQQDPAGTKTSSGLVIPDNKNIR